MWSDPSLQLLMMVLSVWSSVPSLHNTLEPGLITTDIRGHWDRLPGARCLVSLLRPPDTPGHQAREWPTLTRSQRHLFLVQSPSSAARDIRTKDCISPPCLCHLKLVYVRTCTIFQSNRNTMAVVTASWKPIGEAELMNDGPSESSVSAKITLIHTIILHTKCYRVTKHEPSLSLAPSPVDIHNLIRWHGANVTSHFLTLHPSVLCI